MDKQTKTNDTDEITRQQEEIDNHMLIVCSKCGHDQFYRRLGDNALLCAFCKWLPSKSSYHKL